LRGVEVVVAVAEALPFADGVFDGTLSQLVVNFMRDPAAGVREMARVTRQGGIVASWYGIRVPVVAVPAPRLDSAAVGGTPRCLS
jgi:ubiquinone/menaquinone biosynthesis C-methylase UbiE